MKNKLNDVEQLKVEKLKDLMFNKYEVYFEKYDNQSNDEYARKNYYDDEENYNNIENEKTL